MNRALFLAAAWGFLCQGMAFGQDAVTATPIADPVPVISDGLSIPVPSTLRGPEFWVRGEYLFWFAKGMNVPPLVTANRFSATVDQVGNLNDPSTIVLVGNERVLGEGRSGSRWTVGMKITETCDVEATLFHLGEFSEGRTFNSDGGVLLARPFFDPATGQFNSELIAFPGLVRGSISVSGDLDPLYGFELMGRRNWCFAECGCQAPDYLLFSFRTSRVAVMGGYRFLHMEDSVNISESLITTAVNDPELPEGTRFDIQDRFTAENQFHGLQVGGLWEARSENWTIEILGKIALGQTSRRVEIAGSTIIGVPGQAPVALPGGILALSSNSGTHEEDAFSVVPEARITLACQVTDHVKVSAGYSILAWTNVARSGEQINLNVNPALFPPPLPGANPLAPAFQLNESTWWAQGLHAGVEIRF